MNDPRQLDSDDRSWLERLTHFLSGTPQSRADLEGFLSLAADNELIDEDAKTIMEGALSVSDMQVRDIMIPRAQMMVIKVDADIDEALPQIIDAAHSRYPVIDDSLDNVVGILLAKDLLPLIIDRETEFDLKSLLRPTVVVPESKRLNVLLREFRQNRNHMAIVIDEYGGVAGLVTIEDVLEEIVGEIDDEYDEAPTLMTRIEAQGSTVVPASLHHDEVEDATGFEMPEGEYETLAGLVLDRLGHIPEPGEMVSVDGWRLEVVAMDRLRIATVRIVAPPPDVEAES